MRASLAQSELTASPGEEFVVGVEVANTKQVIDAVSVALAGLPGATVKATPEQLALFPSASGAQSVAVELPKGFPAGRHQAALTLRSVVDPSDTVVHELTVEVAEVALASVSLEPARKRGHRKGRFIVSCRNEGNVDLQVRLGAADPERALRLQCEPAHLALKAASSAEAALYVKAPRLVFGREHARTITLTAEVAAPGARQSDPQVHNARATYVQQPTVPRGFVTAAVLASIVALWAAIFSLGLRAVLGEQPLAKSAPLSFFAPLSPPQAHAGRALTPAGFAPKDFAPLAVAGSISGKVTSPGQPAGIGRVTVKAFELGPGGGPPVSAATQSDGTYLIAGLFPGHYKISFSAPGFRTAWYGGAVSEGAAKAVEVGAGSSLQGIDVAMTGLPGGITGHVVTGGAPLPPVEVSLAQTTTGSPGRLNSRSGAGPRTATTKDGVFVFSHLASPATYALSFQAEGFLPLHMQVYVGGGQSVTANAVVLQARPGKISGEVTAGGKPLGGVAVTASEGGASFKAMTPTAGAVGRFTLTDLPTPASYVLSFTKAGFGTQRVALDLGPGQVLGKLQVTMVGGAGTVSGTVFGTNGKPLGGVTVSVGGLAAPVTTETPTLGHVGTYTISGLPTPGNYALTFSRPGYASETVGVKLASQGRSGGVDVTLRSVLGEISGRVTSAKAKGGLGGATVVVTNGSHATQIASTSSGRYTLAQLPPGTYSVTFSFPGYKDETALVRLGAGEHAREDVALEPSR